MIVQNCAHHREVRCSFYRDTSWYSHVEQPNDRTNTYVSAGTEVAISATRLTEARERTMNWDQINGHWRQVKGRIKERWGLMVADFDLVLDGRRDQRHGWRQTRFGDAQRQAEERFRDLCDPS